MTAPDAGPVLVVLAAGKAKRYGGGLKPLAPVGPDGEAILDLTASDALSAGFGTLVLVVNPDTGPTIRSHVDAHWPRDLDVRFAVQKHPGGTVDAVLSAWGELDRRPRFGVANADDLYGSPALGILADQVTGGATANALVGFRLDRAVIGSSPVTRGVCEIDADRHLARIDERRGVAPRDDGSFDTGDDRDPAILGPDTLVSMNLWGFSTSLVEAFEGAMTGAVEGEVLLPELVGRLISERGGEPFEVLPTESRCVGVTHPDDLALVQADVRAQIDRGERPAALRWLSRESNR